MKRLAWFFIFLRAIALATAGTALLTAWVLPASAYIPARESTWRTHSPAVERDVCFESDLSVSYPSMTWDMADRIHLQVDRRFVQTSSRPFVRIGHVPGAGLGWVICHNNPVMYVDPDGRKVNISIGNGSVDMDQANYDSMINEIATWVGADASDFSISAQDYLELDLTSKNFNVSFLHGSPIPIVTSNKGGSQLALQTLVGLIYSESTIFRVADTGRIADPDNGVKAAPKMHPHPQHKGKTMGSFVLKAQVGDSGSTNRMAIIDFEDIVGAKMSDDIRLSYGSASAFFHEGVHLLLGYNDPGKGPPPYVHDFINYMRDDLSLPTRESYNPEELQNGIFRLQFSSGAAMFFPEFMCPNGDAVLL